MTARPAPAARHGELAPLGAFFDLEPEVRESLLLEQVFASHRFHFARNPAYRRTLEARGIGERVGRDELVHLLRPTAVTFKSYVDQLGTPFPQDRPREFAAWLADQISLPLPRERFSRLRRRYRSFEALLTDFERIYAEFGFEIITSSGTSGRASVIVRDRLAVARTVESFTLSFQRYTGLRPDHRAIFLMPRRTRIAMARMARFSAERAGLAPQRISYAIPFPAEPDHVRIRTGRTLRPGWRGELERRLLHPSMNALHDRLVLPWAVRRAMRALQAAAIGGEPVLLFGSWVHLDALASRIGSGGGLVLAPASLVGTGGGMKERYPATPNQIRARLEEVLRLPEGRPVPVRDVYGMAEANWAAIQCPAGHYHVPPWVLARTVDARGRLQQDASTSGWLVFFDPLGGGHLLPAFFRTADRVKLVLGEGTRRCPCGEAGTYIERDSIERTDWLSEAGCAAQV